MRGLKRIVRAATARRMGRVARSAPLMRGLKRFGSQRATVNTIFLVARSAPLMRGLKLGVGFDHITDYLFVARSAPLMRGLKRSRLTWLRRRRSLLRVCRAVCPANEGIETTSPPSLMLSVIKNVARSAPLMRGLKQSRCGFNQVKLGFKSRGLPR